MIEISLNTALIVYSLAVAAGAIVLWLYTELSTKRRFFELKNQYLWRCAICTFVYLDDEAESLSTCPRCHSINSIGDDRAKAVLPRYALAPVEEKDEECGARRNASKQKRKGAKRRGPRRKSR